MSNAAFFNLTIMVSISMILYALIIQHKNKATVEYIVKHGENQKSSLYFGNLAYATFIGKRITMLRYALSCLGLLLLMGLASHNSLNEVNTLHNNEMVLIFTVIWGVFLVIVMVEFFLIQQYGEKYDKQRKLEGLKGNFQLARFCYGYINRMIKLVALSCVSLLLVMF